MQLFSRAGYGTSPVWTGPGGHARIWSGPSRLVVGGRQWTTWAMDDRWPPQRLIPDELDPFAPRRHDAMSDEDRAFTWLCNRDALSCLDGDLLAAARRFHPLVRWHVYRLLANDASGRLLQLLHTCPALLVHDAAVELWLAPDESGTARPGAPLLAAIAGQKLGEVVRQAAREWALAAVHAHAALPRLWYRGRTEWFAHLGLPGLDAAARRPQQQRGCENLPWPAARLPSPLDLPNLFAWRGTGEVREDCVEPQAQLYRRAPADIAPWDLFRPPPVPLVLEDVPREPDDQATWRAVVSYASARSEHGRAGGRSLVAFASRHWRAIFDGKGDERFLTSSDLAILECFAAATGRTLDRRSNAEARIREARAWWQASARRHRAADRVAQMRNFAGPARGPDEPEEQPPPEYLQVPHLDEPGLQLRRLVSPEELSAEGAEMGHCVASYASRVQSGRVTILAIHLEDTRYTASITWNGGRWELRELKGRLNAAPPARVRSWLEDFLQAVSSGLARDPPRP